MRNNAARAAAQVIAQPSAQVSAQASAHTAARRRDKRQFERDLKQNVWNIRTRTRNNVKKRFNSFRIYLIEISRDLSGFRS